MAETIYMRSNKGQTFYTPVHHYVAYEQLAVEALQQKAYLQGHTDGARDMQAELIRRGNALFQLALQKASEITEKLAALADEKGIIVYDFHLKMEDWDKVSSLIVVKLEDYVDDKIDALYSYADEIAMQYSNDTFHWDYSITYHSDTLNRDKILTDGFNHLYEHTPQPRQAQ
jgi:hypothetical protein